MASHHRHHPAVGPAQPVHGRSELPAGPARRSRDRAQLAQDATPTVDVVVDALHRCPGYDWVVLLQPTSPLRTTSDIDTAIGIFLHSASDSLVSVAAAEHPPFWNMVIDDGHLKPLFGMDSFQKRRQDLPETYLPNGAIFISRTETLLRTRSFYTANIVPFVMPIEKSVDIDSETDLMYAETMMKHGTMHG